MTYKFDIEPCPKPRMTRADRWRVRPTTTRYWAFKDKINELHTEELPPVFWITYYITMPQSWSKKKKELMDGKPHQQTPDIDNLTKAFTDSLCENDSYIYEVHERKFWAYTGSIELITNDDI